MLNLLIYHIIHYAFGIKFKNSLFSPRFQKFPTFYFLIEIYIFYFVLLFTLFLLFILLQMSLFYPPCTHTLPLPFFWPSPHCCLCLWVVHISSFADPFTFFHPVPQPFPFNSPMSLYFKCFIDNI